METIKEWALLVAVCGILAEICSVLMPPGESRKTAMLVLGLVVVFCLILPMGNVYDNLLGLDFSYEEEREALTEQMKTYTEDQMLEVTAQFKQRLTDYVCQLVNGVEGVQNCQAELILEEDYTLESYGTLKRIYITAEGTVENNAPTATDKRLSSGFSQMAPVQRIEITLEGITVVPWEADREEAENGETASRLQDPREAKIVALLSEKFQLEENCIFAEVRDA